MRKKTVLFDFDGTLTDSLPLIKHTFQNIFQHMEIPWGDDDVMNLIGLPLREIGRIMAGAGREEEFFNIYQKEYRLKHDELMKTFPGTKEMLRALRSSGFNLGIVTSKSRLGTAMTIAHLQLSDFFDLIVTADDTPRHKPDPAPVNYALQQLQATPANALFIGDSPFDIESGNSAGVTTIGVTWGMAKKEELLKHNPSLLIDTWQELLCLLEL